ncbi:hypothetical protein AB0G02_08970 [Actinosynnema sp. NPDC023658]|uniref:hypothetical protein n=1 Tax=Actinosynnema sp. NPDC023658 TaxID=3155465 RepID=UPI0033DAB674
MLWFLGGYALFIGVLLAYSVHVSLSCPDAERRKDAYRVLRLIWTGVTGTSGVVWLVIKFNEWGLL